MDSAAHSMAIRELWDGADQPAAVMLQLLAQPSAAAALASAVIGLSKIRPLCDCSHSCDGSSSKAAATKTSAPGTTCGSTEVVVVAGHNQSHEQQPGVLSSSCSTCGACINLMCQQLCHVLLPVASSVAAAQLLLNEEIGRGSSSSSAQQAASARLLMLVVARSFVAVHTTLEAAAGAAGTTVVGMLNASHAQSTADAEQQPPFDPVVFRQRSSTAGASPVGPEDAGLHLVAHMSTVMQAAMKQPLQQHPAATAVAWPHLLQLHTVPKLVAAVDRLQQSCALAHQHTAPVQSASVSTQDTAYGTSHDSRSSNMNASSSTASTIVSSTVSSINSAPAPPASSLQPNAAALQQQSQHAACADDLLQEVLRFCRVAAAAVPLPEVCNNPSCQCWDGISEAAAAVKACGACGTRYCSRQCQEAHWQQHSSACKRLRKLCGPQGGAVCAAPAT